MVSQRHCLLVQSQNAFETGYYYLNSRYYDPEVGRFINADDVDVLDIEAESLLHYNLFAYCWNNPVNMTDDNGYLPWFVAAAVGGALFDTAAYLIGSAISGQKITWAGVGKAALTGAITGVAFGALGKGVKALTTAAKATKVGVKIGATFGKMGKLVKYRKITVNWDIITRHGLKRMSERGMSKSLINSVIKNGKVLQQTANKFAYISKKGVIIESNGKIVTTYSNKFFDETIKGYVKQLFG